MAAAMLNLRAQTAGNVLACSNIVRDLSQNSQKRDVEAACLQVQTAPKQLHSLKSSSLRSTSYKQDSSRKRNSSSRITSVLEAQGRRTASKHGEIIKNPAEALMEQFGNLPSSDITHSSVTESADRLFLWESIPKLAEAQTFSVYELNEFDRDSPAFLEFSRQTVNKVDPDTGAQVHALGDQVPFTNKLYDGSLKLRLGITAGICLLMKHYPGMGTPEMKRQQFFFPDRYETLMTWYFGDFGHISGQVRLSISALLRRIYT
jgi:hypothetical protein